MTTELYNILIVDDDEIDRETVKRLLGPEYRCAESASSAEAKACLQNFAADCVLLDYRLPDDRSLDFLGECVDSYLPVVMLTGEESPEIIVNTLNKGAQDFLVKGQLSRTALAFSIQSAVEKVALRRDLDEKRHRLAVQARVLEDKNAQLRRLASELTLAEHRERHRIAQLLHDDLQQQLYGVQISLRDLQRDVRDQDRVFGKLEDAYGQVGKVVQTSRQLTVDMSPPVLKGEGLFEALGWLASQMEERYDLKVYIQKMGQVPVPGEAMRILLFQLVRELLFNVIKHAQITEAFVSLEQRGDQLHIEVSDAGQGFDPQDILVTPRGTGFGLYSVREQIDLFGGNFTIHSSPGAGTKTSLDIPVANLSG